MTKQRLFFAVDLPPQLKTQLLTFQHSLSEIEASPVSADNFHLTLSFLGDVNQKQLERILDHISSPKIPPFEISVSDLLYWAKQQILALAIHDQHSKLVQLKKHIDSQLAEIDIFHRSKNKFAPHITLFRHVEKFSPSDNIIQLEKRFSQSMMVNQISLMQSSESKRGQIYHIIEEWPLSHPSIKQHLTGR